MRLCISDQNLGQDIEDQTVATEEVDQDTDQI